MCLFPGGLPIKPRIGSSFVKSLMIELPGRGGLFAGSKQFQSYVKVVRAKESLPLKTPKNLFLCAD